MNRLAILIALWAFLVSPLRAEKLTLTVDPTASEVNFFLGSTLHDVHGTLGLTEGRLHFDTEGGEAAGLLIIDLIGAKTGNAKRDRKMHQEVLESKLFPKVEFTPRMTEGVLPLQGFGDLQLEGEVALHGSRHPATLQVRAKRVDQRVEATFTLEIPFVKWGLKDPSVFVLRTDKVVQVEGSIEGNLNRP